MKKIFRFFKYKSKRFIYKFLKFVLPIIFCFSIVLSSVLPCYAATWKGNGVTLDIYSSYFWDKVNGVHRVTPIFDYNSTRSRVSFQTKNGKAYQDSQLYAFCTVEDILSVYGYFHLQIVGAQQTLTIKPNTGIYTIAKASNGTSTIGEKIIDFTKIDDSNISMYVTSDYPLPNEFIIFINYTHASSKEVEVRAFDLSYTAEYPVFDDGKHNKEIADSEEALMTKVYDDMSGEFDLGGLGGWINQSMYNGLLFVKGFWNKYINYIPSLENILMFSLTIGLIGFVLSLGGGVFGSIVSYNRREYFDKRREYFDKRRESFDSKRKGKGG